MDTNTPAPQRAPLFDRARARALLRATAKGGARDIGTELLELTNMAGSAETSATKLAARLGSHPRNVQQHLARLRAEGWIKVQHRGNSEAVYTWSREKLAEAWTSERPRIVRDVDTAATDSGSSKPLLSLAPDPAWKAVLRAYENARDTVHPDARGALLGTTRTEEDAAELVRVGQLVGEEVQLEGEPLAEAIERELTRGFVVWMRQHRALHLRQHPLCFAAEDADRILVYVRRSRPRPAAAPPIVAEVETPRVSGFQEVLRAVGAR